MLTNNLKEALKENNFEEVANQVHGFKTKWIMMGMDEARELAIALELQCRKPTPDNALIHSNAGELLKYIKNATQELKNMSPQE